MGMEAADPMRTPRAQNASFNHAPRYAVIAGQLFRVPLVARPLLSISAFRAEFGLGVIWLSAVRIGGLFRAATPLVADRRNAAVRLFMPSDHSPRQQPVEQCNDGASVVPARHDGWSRVMSLQNAMARGWVNIFRSNRPRFDCRLG